MSSPAQGPLAGVSKSEPEETRLLRRPWRAFLLVLALHGAGFALVGVVLYRVFRLPQDLSNIEALPTAAHFTLAVSSATCSCPSCCAFPSGSRSFSRYLDDIRLTRVKPFLPLLLLTVSCLSSSSGARARAHSSTGSRKADRSPGNSWGRCSTCSRCCRHSRRCCSRRCSRPWRKCSSRGVLLTMLLRVCSPRKAIVYSAAAFGLMHLPGIFVGTARS